MFPFCPKTVFFRERLITAGMALNMISALPDHPILSEMAIMA